MQEIPLKEALITAHCFKAQFHNSTTLLSGGIDALRRVDQVDQVRQSSLYISMAMEGYAPQWKLAHACGPEWLSAEECAFRVWAPHGEDVTVELQCGESSVQEIRLTREGDFWIGQARCAPGDRYRIAMGSTWNDCFQQEGAKLFRRDPCARECDFNSRLVHFTSTGQAIAILHSSKLQ